MAAKSPGMTANAGGRHYEHTEVLAECIGAADADAEVPTCPADRTDLARHVARPSTGVRDHRASHRRPHPAAHRDGGHAHQPDTGPLLRDGVPRCRDASPQHSRPRCSTPTSLNASARSPSCRAFSTSLSCTAPTRPTQRAATSRRRRCRGDLISNHLAMLTSPTCAQRPSPPCSALPRRSLARRTSAGSSLAKVEQAPQPRNEVADGRVEHHATVGCARPTRVVS